MIKYKAKIERIQVLEVYVEAEDLDEAKSKLDDGNFTTGYEVDSWWNDTIEEPKPDE